MQQSIAPRGGAVPGGEHAMHMMLGDADRCSSAATGPGDAHVARCGANRRKPDHRADARRRARRTSRPRRARLSARIAQRATRNAQRDTRHATRDTPPRTASSRVMPIVRRRPRAARRT
ncbi:hypothetical protein AQ939_02565 [Burkholderia pseudomallei]|nr:hypothetical protein AQ937_28255 [Burkholderia pseudomallei]OND67949.1 hypothetical protein AQ936_27680 [Burkholderia pseudomallei]OND84646.1 hypothetical protein AQ939_02565 [Burkholderia pseudomallei]